VSWEREKSLSAIDWRHIQRSYDIRWADSWEGDEKGECRPYGLRRGKGMKEKDGVLTAKRGPK